MKVLKLVVRLVLGVVFTFSGFVKAVDPLGSAYKFTDYFTDAFGIPALSSFALALAFILSALEFLVGICLILNVKPRLSALGALLFMLVFTPLTLYIAIASPVSDCGCFGDALVLTNWETFFKNLVLLPMAIYLFSSTKGEDNTYKGAVDWIVAGILFAVSILFQFYNLRHLPVIDFRAYKVGTHIPDMMVIPEGEKADSFAIFYTMKHLKTGETKEVDDNSYIEKEIWKDTLWQITETSEPVLVKSGYKPPIYNFRAYPVNLSNVREQESEDAMGILLAEKNFSFMVIAYDLTIADMNGFDKMAELINYAYPKGIHAHLLTSSTSELLQFKTQIRFPVKFYNSDPTTLKTVVRSNPGLLLLKEGKIIGKWHYNDVPSIEEFDKMLTTN